MPTFDLPALIAALSRPDAYPHPVDSVEVHQTHISVVFLAGPFAYKIKKPVNLGFLDFSTLEKRRHYCEEEIRLNRRLAPQVYAGVVPISYVGQAARLPESEASEPLALRCGMASEPLALRVASEPLALRSGAEHVVEWAVKMQRLPSEATLEHRLRHGDVTTEQICAVARRLADFHRDADTNEQISSYGRFDAVAGNARENFTQAAALVGTTVSPSVFERLRALTEAHLARLRPLIESRAQNHVPRDTHGDLRLDHVYFFPDERPPGDLVIIDCIEFSDRFRFADPIADLAFLAMDLSFHGRRDLARVFVDAYFTASGDGAGRNLLPYYTAYRAVIRAKVEGIEQGESEIARRARAEAAAKAKAHWLLALGELEEPRRRPTLVMIAGLPGAGKSTLANTIAADANFDVLRSDVIRKELSAGRTDIYTAAWTEKAYGELFSRADELLWQGRRVLIDANFRDDAWRVRFLGLARRWAVPALFVHCHADPAIVRQRLDVRDDDASDADWRVYQELESDWQPLSADVRRAAFALDTSGDAARSVQALAAKLRADHLL